MTEQEAIKKGYTHLVLFFGYKCYFNCWTNEVVGVNFFVDIMVGICVWVQINVYDKIYQDDSDCWAMKVLKELK